MIRHKKVDAVTIGVGWVGGILADELTRAGLQVVGLERGGTRGTDSFSDDHDELGYAIRGKLFQDPKVETTTIRHTTRERALPIRRLGAWLPGTGLGGAGVHWNGVTWRFHPSDLEYHSHYTRRYGADVFPEDMRQRDWGITYDQLERYYDRFERMAGISGKAGVLRGKVQPGGNPFEGSRRHEYPTPPMLRSTGGRLFETAASGMGYSPFPLPSANLSVPYVDPQGNARNHCLYCGFCERFGCEVGAKADPTVTVLPRAMRSGLFELRTEAWVTRIVHEDGRASAVRYVDAQGREHEQPADIVIVSAFMLNNVRLLLLSGLGQPYDPRTESGAVGRNFAYQVNGGPTGFFPDEDGLNVFMGSGANGIAIEDFGGDNFDHGGLGFVGGGVIYMNSTGIRPILGQSLPPGTPSWGRAYKDAVRTSFRHQVSLSIQAESPAYRQHYLSLDPTYKDAYGDPLLRVTFDWQRNEKRMLAYLGKQADRILKEMGPARMVPSAPLADTFDSTVYQSTHVTGGAIIGDDPRKTVVNDYLQMWDAENVFVVGASAFPQNANFNPTGTVGALAYRAADGIVNHYLKRPGPLR